MRGDQKNSVFFFFFFNDTATTEIYTLSLHDALPIWRRQAERDRPRGRPPRAARVRRTQVLRLRRADTPMIDFFHRTDRKSTRLNSSHANISYAVFCLKKKKNYIDLQRIVEPVCTIDP